MSKHSPDITFVLFTFNEELRIERAIRNFKHYGHILIVDNQSSDHTRDIALQHGCEVLINKNAGWVEDEVTTARVKAAVTTPWIYWGFADEMVEAETIEIILGAVSTGTFDIISIARKNYYYGVFCQDLFAERTNRIFRKEAIDFTANRIHNFGQIVEGARIYELPFVYFVHHFISNTARSYLEVVNRYTDTESMEDRPVHSIFRLLGSTAKIILVNALFRRGYRAGAPGVFLIAHMVYYRWLSAMKIYEKTGHLNRDVIESANDVARDQILRSIP